MYGDQFGKFVCGYWGLKGKTICTWTTVAPWADPPLFDGLPHVKTSVLTVKDKFVR